MFVHCQQLVFGVRNTITLRTLCTLCRRKPRCNCEVVIIAKNLGLAHKGGGLRIAGCEMYSRGY